MDVAQSAAVHLAWLAVLLIPCIAGLTLALILSMRDRDVHFEFKIPFVLQMKFDVADNSWRTKAQHKNGKRRKR